MMWNSAKRDIRLLTLGAMLTMLGCSTTGPGTSAVTVAPGNTNSAIEDQAVVPKSEVVGENVELPKVEEAQLASPVDFEKWKQGDLFSMYRIGSGDMLSFRSFDDETLNTEVVVRHDGYISLPWISDVKVMGKTREEATALVREAYSALYVDAEVSLQITDARSQVFTVMGDVSHPAEYPYTKPLTLLAGITQAGGLRINQRAGDSFISGQGQLVKAFVIRHVEGERQVAEYDLKELQQSGAHDSDAPVFPGDTIYIPQGVNLVYVLGEVRTPNVYALSENATLLQMLANAGGFLETSGRLSQVILMREKGKDETEVLLVNAKHILKNGGDVLLKPGDVIYVPRKRLVTLQEFIQRGTGVISPILSVGQQALGLYTQAWDAYYVDERTNRLYEDGDEIKLQNQLNILDVFQDLGSLADEL
ncbi:MAG: SLBB domain-containing protein [Candidatus Hydrogenedentes bacterium]|nr:SLBB domain-containing protein [Candidatus Hydrogenedentota bacterium]